MAGEALYSFKFAGKAIETTIADNLDDIEVLVKAVGRTPTQVLLKKRKAEEGDVTIVVAGDAEHASPAPTLSREGDLVGYGAEAEEILRVDLKVARDQDRQDLETYKSFGLSPEERKLLEARTDRAEERVVAL